MSATLRTITFQAEPELYDRARDRAEAEDRSMASLQRQALRRYLNGDEPLRHAEPLEARSGLA